jgi:hypothetical protein
MCYSQSPFFFWIILCGLLLGLCLPLSIFLEFRKTEKWYLYFQLYPHMTLFPTFFFWLIFVSFSKVVCMEQNWHELSRYILGIVALTFFALDNELKADDLMLFEISPRAKITIFISQLPHQIFDILKTCNQSLPIEASVLSSVRKNDNRKIEIVKASIISNLEIFLKKQIDFKEEDKRQFHFWMNYIISYKLWQDKRCFSNTRFFYGLTYFVMVINMLFCILLFLFSLFKDRNNLSYIYHLFFSCLIFLFWIPLRLYYVYKIKGVMLGIKSFQIIRGGKLDPFIYVALTLFTSSLFYLLSKGQLSLLLIALFTIILIFTIYSSFNLEIIDNLFGLNSRPYKWTVWIFISIFLYYIMTLL